MTLKSFHANRILSYPEQFTDRLNVDIDAENEGHCIITIISEKGRIRRMMGINLNKGNNSIAIDNVSSLENGTYQLQVKNTKAKILYSSNLTKP